MPPRVFPGGGSTLSQNFRTFPGSTTPTNIVKSSPSSRTPDSESSASLINPQINETIENDSVMVSSSETESNQIDLDNLPPPPPPPNIVPPTPPPDILPLVTIKSFCIGFLFTIFFHHSFCNSSRRLGIRWSIMVKPLQIRTNQIPYESSNDFPDFSAVGALISDDGILGTT